jgi:hypothetical protein
MKPTLYIDGHAIGEIKQCRIRLRNGSEYSKDYRSIYERADDFCSRYAWMLLIGLFALFIAGNLVRACQHYDAWKWMVQP